MKRSSILVIDDDRDWVAAMIEILESRYEVRSARNGKEAMGAIRANLPDLVILDVMMDYMSEGFDVARALRDGPETKTIPIIMISGVDRYYDYRTAQAASWVPCDVYLEKPVDPEVLLENIAALLA